MEQRDGFIFFCFKNKTGAMAYSPSRPLLVALPKTQSPIAEIRVAQLPRAPRVPPHWNRGAVR